MYYFIGVHPSSDKIAKLFYSIPSDDAEKLLQSELEHNCRKALATAYGEDKQAQERLEQELRFARETDSAIGFKIQQEIASFAQERGGIASAFSSGSLLSYLLGATTVNPLPAHYLCQDCHRTDYSTEAKDGFDLPPRRCPVCGKIMMRDGHDLPAQLYWTDTKKSPIYPDFAMRVSALPLNELQRILDNSITAEHMEEWIYRELEITTDRRCNALAILAKDTGVQLVDVPIDTDGRFHDHIRQKAYNMASFTTDKTPDDLGRPCFYVSKEELFRIFTEQGFSPDVASLRANQIARHKEAAFADVPEEYRGNMSVIRNLWKEAPCVSFTIWDLQLKWYQQNYPAQFREICGES